MVDVCLENILVFFNTFLILGLAFRIGIGFSITGFRLEFLGLLVETNINISFVWFFSVGVLSFS